MEETVERGGETVTDLAWATTAPPHSLTQNQIGTTEVTSVGIKDNTIQF